MSPFIVTTKRRTKFDVMGPDRDEWKSLSRRAVATLEEARELAWQQRLDQWHPDNPSWLPIMKAINALTESGGTVGPLPDGTVIEVEPTTYHALWHAVPWDSGLRGGAYMETDGDQNIAAFNAAQAEGLMT